MKRFFMIIGLVAGLSFAAQAETTATPTKAATVNVFGALVDYFGGTYEFAVMDHLSILVEAGFSPNLLWVTNLGMYDGRVEARYYFEKAVSGFYLGGGVMATGLFGGYTDSFNYTYTYSGFLPGAGITAGYKWIVNPAGGFFLEPSIGYSVYMGTVSMSTKDATGSTVTGTGTIPAIGGFSGGLGLGWAF